MLGKLARLSVALLFAVLAGILHGATAQAAVTYKMAVGNENESTYGLGVGISSLIKVKLFPVKGVDLDTVVTTDGNASLDALRNAGAQFALVEVANGEVVQDPLMQAVATLRRTGNLSTTLMVRSDVDNQVVHDILGIIFEHQAFLASIDPSVQNMTPDNAVMGLAMPLHSGAKAFYAENWADTRTRDANLVTSAQNTVAPRPVPQPREEIKPLPLPDSISGTINDARSFVFYFGFNESNLDDQSRRTLQDVEAFAKNLRDPAIIVAAYTDTVGDSDYNYLLAERRANAVLEALESFGVAYSDVTVSLFGERSPWIVTLDDVDEAYNRRVELFVEQPVGPVELLPIAANEPLVSEQETATRAIPAASPAAPATLNGSPGYAAPSLVAPADKPAGVQRPKPLM